MYSYQEKLNHLYLLVKLANIEDIYSEAEHIFIRKVAEKMDIDLQDLEHYDPKQETKRFPDNEHKVIPLFHRLLILMGIDRTVTIEESDFCLDMGIKMGLHPQAVIELIDMVKKHGSPAVLMPNVVTGIFKKYYN